MRQTTLWATVSVALVVAACTGVPKPQIAADAVRAVLPVSGWTAPPKDGLAFAITPQGPSAALVRVSGTATAANWANIVLAPKIAAASVYGPDVTATVSVAAGDLKSLSAVALQVAAFQDAKYLGEVDAKGQPISAAASAVTVAGQLPAGATTFQPYIQVRYEAGAAVDVTLLIDSPTLLNKRP